MKEKVFGILFTILGITGLLTAGYNLLGENTVTNHSTRNIVTFGLLGSLFFFGGIGLIRNTKDPAKRN